MIGFPCAEESMLSHFDTIPQHDRRADERTDRQTMLSISRVSITVLMRDKNSVGSSVNEKNFKTGLPPIGLSLQFIVASKASRAELLLLSLCSVTTWTRPQGGQVHYTHAVAEASYDLGRS